MKTFARANCTKSSTATGCGVLLAGTVARSQTGNPAFVRFATTGAELFVPWAMSAASNVTPSRKKPSSMLIRGTGYSFGMLGCDLHCGYRQNWVTSQALRDPAAAVGPMRVTSRELVLDALGGRGRLYRQTYDEPLITSEWAIAVFKEARATGLVTGFVQRKRHPQFLENAAVGGSLQGGPEEFRCPAHYRQLGGAYSPSWIPFNDRTRWALAGDRYAGDSGFNDSDDELTRLAGFLAGVPQGYSLACNGLSQRLQNDRPGRSTDQETLIRAAEIGKKAAYRYVYAGTCRARSAIWKTRAAPIAKLC